MKKILTLMAALLAINFLALAGGVGWLWRSGHLDKAKALQVRDLIFPKPAPPATQPSDSPNASKVNALEQLLAQQSGHSATEQVQFIQKTFDSTMLQIDRRQRELADLQRQVDAANRQLAKDRETLEKQKKDLAQKQQEATKLETDTGFQNSLALYQAMPAKQVKTIFMGLSDQIVTQYLQAMSPRDASKIIKEFKTPEESAFIEKVLEAMRSAQATAAEPASAPVPGAGNK